MSKLKSNVEQSRNMAVLVQERTDLLEQLVALDNKIMALESGKPAVKEEARKQGATEKPAEVQIAEPPDIQSAHPSEDLRP